MTINQKKMELLTADELKRAIHYDPESGVFTWLRSGGGVSAGAVAGSKSNRGYWLIRINGIKYCAHRLAFLYMDGVWPPELADHIDGDVENNRWANLRQASFGENVRNRKMQKNNTSGYRGVGQCPRTKSFYAAIYIENKRKHLGTFASAEAASAIYEAAAAARYGEFRRSADTQKASEK